MDGTSCDHDTDQAHSSSVGPGASEFVLFGTLGTCPRVSKATCADKHIGY